MDELRALLLLIGCVILAGLFIAHRRRSHKPRHQADWRTQGQAPTFDRTASRDEGESDEDDSLSTETSYRDQPIQPGLKGISPPLNEYSEVITLYVRKKTGQPISGSALSSAAKRAGLTFGEMNIFHRIQEGFDQPVFSMANGVAPGDFNPDDWDHFETPGISLFAKLPGPISALDCWDSMLATATRLTELLEGEILDSNRVLLSRKRIGEMRDRMRELDRNAGLISDDD